jgi:hypothetical protein
MEVSLRGRSEETSFLSKQDYEMLESGIMIVPEPILRGYRDNATPRDRTRDLENTG